MRRRRSRRFSSDGGLPLGDDLRRTVEAWLVHLAHERGAADKTLEAYERDLRQFLAWLKGDLGHAPCLADLARLDAKRFRAFMAARRRAGLAGRSLARTMSALRTFFRWLEAEEIAHNRGVLQVALPKVPHGIPKPLTVEQGGRRDRCAARRPSSTGSRPATPPCCCCSTARACASPRRWR